MRLIGREKMMNIKKIRPLWSHVLVTKEVYTEDVKTGGIITKKSGTVKEYQKVVAVGELVRNIKEGDLVYICPERYAVRKYQENSVKKDLLTNQIVGYDIPQVTIDGVVYMLLENNDIKYVIEDYDDSPDSGIIHPNKSIIL